MTNRLSIKWRLAAGAALAFILATDAAHAQSADPQQAEDTESAGGLSDIVVTARRKSESLISVPLAVTAVNSAMLERSNVTSLESAAAIVPFVTVARVGAGNGGFMSIRGIASTPQDAGAQQSVLTNIDYILIGRGRLATMAMFDIKQIEVLKGPQSLYYGKNTTAGVFSITSNDPGSTLGGYVKAGYEFEAQQRYLDAAVDVPLNESLKMRVAGHYSKMRGWIRNKAVATAYPVGGAYQPWITAGITTAPGASSGWGPNDQELAGRVTLVYQPTSDLTAKLKYTFGRTTNTSMGATGLYLPYCLNGQTGVTSFGALDPYSDCNRDYVTSMGNLPPAIAATNPMYRDGRMFAKTVGHLASLNIDYSLSDNLTLASITGYYHVNFDGSGNFSPSVWAGVFPAFADKASGISQELRLASDFDTPVNFEIGGFIDSLKMSSATSSNVVVSRPDPASGRFDTYTRIYDAKSHSYSVFGKLNWKIVDTVTLSGGVRYTKYDLDSVDGNSFVNPVTALATVLRPQGDYFVRSYSDRNYSPEITLNWQPTQDQNLYVSYKTGYKSGGFSYPSVLQRTYTAANTQFKPEEAHSIEAGYKAQLFDRRLRVDFAAYRINISNQQLSSFDAQAFAFFVGNAGKSRVQGLELQLTAAVVEGAQIFGSVGYNDGKYVSFPAAQCVAFPTPPSGCTQNLSGRVLPRAPKWAGNFGASYEVPVGSNMKIVLNGMGTFSSRYYTLDSLDPNGIQPAFVKWDAGIAVASADDRWRFSLQGRNLSNKYVTLYAYDAARMLPASYISVPQRGRQVAIEGTFNF